MKRRTVPRRAATGRRASRGARDAAASLGTLAGGFDALSASIAVLDRRGTVIFVNQPWRRFVLEDGLAGSPCGVGMNYLEECDRATGSHAAEARRAAVGIRAVIAGEQDEFTLEYTCPSAHATRCFGLRVSRFHNRGTLCIVVAHLEVTALRQTELALRESEAGLRLLEQRAQERTIQLEAANKELETFCYSVSHDLRAPLRSITGFAKALRDDYGDALGLDARHLLERVLAGGQRMEELIDDLLVLSRTSRAEMQRQPVSLSDLAREVGEELQRAYSGRHVALVVAPGVIADGDARLLRVMMDNLLANAWKYTAKHATARIEFGIDERDGERVYFVRDDGAGFDMQYADKLFGPFQRLHSAHEFSGSGVGLATVQRIIVRHGGRIWAEAAVEQGATFWFTLGGLVKRDS